MEQKLANQTVMSTKMRAVMTIISACSDLTKTAGPYIDVKLEQINWDLIFKQSWCLGQKAALAWAFALWRDEPRPRFNVFENSRLMDQELQIAVIKAIMIRWGFTKRSVDLLNQQPNQRGCEMQAELENRIDIKGYLNYIQGRCS